MDNYKIEIIGSAVVITNTTGGFVENEYPRRDTYYKIKDLLNDGNIILYDTNGISTGNVVNMFNVPIANAVDGADVPFTVASFRTFAQENLGFNTGGGAAGVLAFEFTAVNYTDLITNVAPVAEEGQLAMVYNSQGVWLISRKLKGVYMYQSGVWEYANQELQDILKAKIDSIVAGSVVEIDVTDPLNPIVNVLVASQLEVDTGTENNKVVTPLTLRNTRGVQGFFLDAKGSFGTGGGWADSGFIDDLPILLFDYLQQERAIFMFFAGISFLLDQVNPTILFAVWSTDLPVIGNNDVRLQLTCRYISLGETTDKVADEVILLTHTLTELTAKSQQPIVAFVLDRTKIASGDVMNFKLERIGGDPLDTYDNSDLGIGQSGNRIETLIFNP